MKAKSATVLAYSSLSEHTKINLSPAELVEQVLSRKEGALTSTGALSCHTGNLTGRSPKDRYIVRDEETEGVVDWGAINRPIAPSHYEVLYASMREYLAGKCVYVRDAYAGTEKKSRLSLRVFNTLAWHNLFCYNMFLRVEKGLEQHFVPDFTIIAAPCFHASPEQHGTRCEHFVVINLSAGIILLGGTAYAGEIKKGVFTVMNYLLPRKHNTLPMHCSANVGKKGDTAIFFGLSGTGKTTLSADPNRRLIGDDEHGWHGETVFNFEGGCYAKVIDLKEEKEPQIWYAIRFGAIVENTRFYRDSREVNYADSTLTENTRVSYPIHYIDNALSPSIGRAPANMFLLTADAFGVLPPIARLTKEQAMYHFISGYTSKVAGTESGIDTPVAVFSTCYAAPFLPLSPVVYAEMLGENMEKFNVNVWLVNTGWTGGSYESGAERIALSYTRAMITAALTNALTDVPYQAHDVFGVNMPASCPDVPSRILDPIRTWQSEEAYYQKAWELAATFHKNFAQYKNTDTHQLLAGGPYRKEEQGRFNSSP